MTISVSPSSFNSASSTFTSTGTVPSTMDRREWWADESVRIGTDWRSLFELHCQIVDRLRASSSWAWSS